LLKKQQLLEKLYKEGLFDASRKRNLPLFPKNIGVITSADGAAIEDIRKNLFNRTKRVELYLFPCVVQGNDAITSIKNAILRSLDYDIDVLIIGRGGGSKEDLSAFDDEHLARLIAEYPKPVISAIGHEIDKSVIDYVSDLSVSTPTAAANKVVFDDSELLESINEFNSNINLYMQSKINEYKTKLNHLSDFSFFKDYSSYFNKLKIDIEKTEKILNNYWIYTKNQLLDKISSKEEILSELNPYNILDKGYSIIYDKNNNVLSKVNDIKNQEELIIRVKDGTVTFGGKDK
jgi:exodeoxyribonuclease VII large subunit